jgi:hypothetical protein
MRERVRKLKTVSYLERKRVRKDKKSRNIRVLNVKIRVSKKGSNKDTMDGSRERKREREKGESEIDSKPYKDEWNIRQGTFRIYSYL